jgi:hypothetical protein
MNYYYNFDINVYNSFIYYSGGYIPTYSQYQAFAKNLYEGQMQNYLINQTQMSPQQIQMPPQQIQMPPEHIQMPPEHIQMPQEQKLSVCIKGMMCKDIKCKEFHHPSKDLDILNASKK